MQRLLRSGRWLVCLILVCLPAVARGENASLFTASEVAPAELRFIKGLPVVTVAGTPDEIGTQLGTLLKQPVRSLIDKQDDLARGFGLGVSARAALRSGLAQAGQFILPKFPEAYQRELKAVAAAAQVDVNLLVLGNVMYELSKVPACSTLGVEPARSSTGGTLLGRNLDFPTFGFLDRYSLLVVYRPEGKHAFVSVTFAGFAGVVSGMNEVGLCVAQLEVGQSKAPRGGLNFNGTPVAMCFRQLLEECSTIDEAEKLLRTQRRLIQCNLAVADRTGTAVFEITPDRVERRAADEGLCICTNHFRTEPLTVNKECWRYDRLIAAEQRPKLGTAEIQKLLDAANQGGRTIQTMIFEPAADRLHVSLGPAPSSAQTLTELDLKSLFSADE